MRDAIAKVRQYIGKVSRDGQQIYVYQCLFSSVLLPPPSTKYPRIHTIDELQQPVKRVGHSSRHLATPQHDDDPQRRPTHPDVRVISSSLPLSTLNFNDPTQPPPLTYPQRPMHPSEPSQATPRLFSRQGPDTPDI